MFLAIAWLVPAGLFASGTIRGRVVDAQTGAPLPGANVQAMGTLRGASADLNGVFVIPHLEAGTYAVRATMMGYRFVTLSNVRVTDGATTDVTFRLKETPIAFDPVVVLAGKSEQRLDEAPVSISVVTAREIARRNPPNLIGALETAPGVHFVGNQINIRGSSGYSFGAGNKVLLLLDGVPVYASDTGEFNWDMIPPHDIERIEVQKGAGSTLWGASALGGVVNIITRDPESEGLVRVHIAGGKFDKPYYPEWEWTERSRLYFLREDVSFSKRAGRVGVRLSAGHAKSTGYTMLGESEKVNLTGKFDVRLSDAVRWTTYAAWNRTERGYFIQWMGPNDPYEVDTAYLDNVAATNQLNIYTRMRATLSSRLALSVRASMVRTLMGTTFGTGADFNPAYGQGAEVQADLIPVPGHTVTGGVQFQLDAGSTQFFGSHKGYFIGPYLQDEWAINDNLKLTTGFRYDRYQLVGGLKEDLLSPRVGINWRPWKGTSFRASAGSGFRAATIVERFLELSVMNFTIKANPDLAAESSRAYDVGFRQAITSDWHVDVSLFDTEYWNLIEAHLDLLRGQIQFRNIPRARIRGLELTTRGAARLSLFRQIVQPSLEVSLTAMDHEDLKWHEPLTYRPKVLTTVKASLGVGPVTLQADYRYASKIDAVKIYPINARVPMHFVDVRAMWDMGPMTLKLGATNIFQYNYAPMESNLMPPRTFTVGLEGSAEVF